MLAGSQVPQYFLDWNRTHSAPYGARSWRWLLAFHPKIFNSLWRQRFRLPLWLMRWIGPFGFQSNSKTRIFEYPWHRFASELSGKMKILEVGAGASGFQFALANEGFDVTSVDPMIEATAHGNWNATEGSMTRLNRAFGSTVKLHFRHLEEARFASDHFDRIFSISVLEHIPQRELPILVREMSRILRPGGLLILTVDLFLDCFPFSKRVSNQWGTNISLKALVEESGLELTHGNRRELYGFEEFDVSQIRRDIKNYYVFNQVAVQCLILKKPVRAEFG